MAHYIDKSALVAEIERRKNICNNVVTTSETPVYVDYYQGKAKAYKETIDLLSTLEVKKVDLDFQRFAKEMDAIFALPSSETKNTEEEPLNWEYAIAKHFFELGMAVSNKAQKGEEV